METFLKILKGTFRFIISSLLWLVLGVGLAVLAVTTQITNRDTVKSWPQRAGIYENLVETFPELVSDSDQTKDEDNIQDLLDQSGLDQDALLDSIGSAINPDFIETQANIAFDALYDLLEGEVDVLQFTLTLGQKSAELADVLADELIDQIEQYPKCTPGQLASMGNDFDPFAASCLPPGLDFNKEILSFSKEFALSDDAVLQDAEIKPQDLEVINDHVEEVQLGYSTAKNLPQILLFVVVFLGALLVLLSRSVLFGLRKLGAILAVQGLITAVLFWLFPRLSSGAIDSIRSSGQEGDEVPKAIVDKLVEPIFEVIFGDISTAGIRYGLLAGLCGVAIWLGVYIWHKVHHHRQDAHAPVEHQQAPNAPVESEESLPKKD